MEKKRTNFPILYDSMIVGYTEGPSGRSALGILRNRPGGRFLVCMACRRLGDAVYSFFELRQG